ncbi:MAG: hypothetical protein H0S79_24825 [Anaerolineaceae bacterium]|nr:hypothetical protein [Anaerolineaceae bacterium]
MTILTLGLMLLPGLAAWAWLGKRGRDPMVTLAQIISISLAAIALLAEWAFTLGIRFSPLGIGLILGGLGGTAVIGFIRLKPQLNGKWLWSALIGLALFGGLVAWRLHQADGLLLPNWVDSQHHYLIIRAILEQRGLPETLAPYLDQPFYYHFGFHAATALFTSLSGLSTGQSILVFGQLLNASVSLSIYALGKTLWKDWRPALAAAILTGLVTRMPAYFLTWGRYPLTAGLVLLPLAIAAALRLKQKPGDKRETALLAILTGGVLLTHYFTALLLAFFLFVLILAVFLPRLKTLLTALFDARGVLIGAGLGLLLALPWVLRVLHLSALSTGLESNLPDVLNGFQSATDTAPYIWKLLGPASNHWLLIPAGIGLIWAFIKRRRVVFGVWTVLCAILALPWSVALKPFRPDHFAITFFLPLSLFAGWAFWQAGVLLSKWLKRSWIALLIPAFFVAGWSVWGFSLSSHIVNSVTVLVTEPDIEALDWVTENTPTDARFLINTTYWQNSNYRGVDGGGWLLPYTGRWSLVPTVFYGFSPDKGDVRQLIQWGKAASTLTTCDAAFWELVDEANLDYLYIREGTGSLQVDGLAGCEGISQTYQNDQVEIFQILH